MNKLQTVTIKSVTDDAVTIAGYGVVFGGVDLDGETFNAETDFMLDLVPNKPVLYDHGMNDAVQKSIIGNVAKAASDDTGLWVEAELSRHQDYIDAIMELIEKGALGWSSGTAGQLAMRDGRIIKRWPVVEFSLTPTPAEPRTLGIEQMKALAEMLPELEKLSAAAETRADDDIEPETVNGETDTPEAGRTPAATVPEANDGSTVAGQLKVNTQTEDIPMSEKSKAVDAEISDQIAEAEAAGNTEVLDAIKAIADSMKAIGDRVEAIEAQPVNVPDVQTPGAAPVVKSLGDNERNAFAAWYRSGDTGGVKHMVSGENEITVKASNATDMNITTDADGGYAVPTGHYQGIIARMHETSLYQRLGVMNIPGRGTTVNIPVDAEADGEWVATNEAADSDLDTPAIGTVASTLVKYTKYLPMSAELLDDEDSNLLAFVEQWVGSGLGRTHNSLLVTEALANGTAGLTLDGAAAITAAEIPELMYKLKGEYADGAAWLMARATEAKVRGLTGDDFVFGPRPGGAIGVMPTLFGAPVYNSQYVPAATTGLKSMIFGNFGYMGLRQSASVSFLRNPFLLARSGQIALHYYTRIDYAVLQSEAIQFATQA